jgi:cell division protein FtsZ
MIPRVAEPEAEDPKERTADISYATTDPISLASPEAVAAALAANPLADDGTSNLSNVARIAAAKKAAREAKQEQMQFEPITRGRFEKSEPTIVDGQDLDVPTFLRRNLKIR